MYEQDVPILVVAGTYAQAMNWAHEHNLNLKQWRYVDGEHVLIGRRHNEIVFIGNWLEAEVMRIYASPQQLADLRSFNLTLVE